VRRHPWVTRLTPKQGFEVIKQLLSQGQPYNLILGVRNIEATRKALDGLQYDSSKHKLTVLPLELSDLKGVGVFAKEMLGKLGQDRIDFLMLNAALTAGATSKEGPHGSKWCTQYLVNHLCTSANFPSLWRGSDVTAR